MRTETTALLVIGGGLAGSAAALFAAHRGVDTLLVERHPGSSAHPRAVGYKPRTVELLRSVGLESRIPTRPGRGAPRRKRVESLAGQHFEELKWAPAYQAGPVREYSPCGSAGVAQDILEPTLREAAAEHGADIRMSTTMESFRQDADGVEAVLRGTDGEPYRVRAAYLIGADGHRSPVREALGIGRGGKGHQHTTRSILFRAPLAEYLADSFVQFMIEQPDFKAGLLSYGDGRWVLMYPDDGVDRDQAAQRALLAKAIGRDTDIDLITTGRWQVGAHIADRFADGRVFLAGDAAHTLPPGRGGYGANIGIADVHNLVWKLAAVLAGRSQPRLLDSYDAERRPIAWLCHDQMFAAADAPGLERLDVELELYGDDAMIFGQRYAGDAIADTEAVPAGGLPDAATPDEWAGRPGTRAPHLWLERDGRSQSTLDLFGEDWVLLAENPKWRNDSVSLVQLGTDVAIDLDAYRRAFGVGADGAVLVRPDGYIAWRAATPPADPATAAESVHRRLSAAALGQE